MDNICNWRRWCTLKPLPFVSKYDFLRLTAIQRQTICPRTSMFSTSAVRESTLMAGIIRLVTSANLHSWLPWVTAFKLLGVTTYAAGPMDDAGRDGFQGRLLTTVYSDWGDWYRPECLYVQFLTILAVLTTHQEQLRSLVDSADEIYVINWLWFPNSAPLIVIV
jgi:hypothetical protein